MTSPDLSRPAALAAVVRSGLVESVHYGAVAALASDGQVLAAAGDIDRTFFLRSAAKPFQATASQEFGAALEPEQMAVACASHRGQPAHIALVRGMLEEVGLDESALRCPPAWPSSATARDRVVAQGHRRPQRIWHNCSGKHAAMLRACVAQGWPRESYLDPDHPLQRGIGSVVGEALGHDPGPVGIDGCGAPVFRGTVRSLALAFARLGSDDRFAYAWTSMHRFPSLTYDQGRAATMIATWLNAAAKVGAEGSCGVALRDGVGIALKSWDGATRANGPVLVDVLRHLGYLPAYAAQVLWDVGHPVVLGGGRPVGEIQSQLELATAEREKQL